MRPRLVGNLPHTRLNLDAAHFHIHALLNAYEGENRVYSKDWNLRLERHLV